MKSLTSLNKEVARGEKEKQACLYMAVKPAIENMPRSSQIQQTLFEQPDKMTNNEDRVLTGTELGLISERLVSWGGTGDMTMGPRERWDHGLGGIGI